MFVKLTGSCPHCGVKKHQIDTSEDHAVEVLNKAFAAHIAEDHPDISPTPGKSGHPPH